MGIKDVLNKAASQLTTAQTIYGVPSETINAIFKAEPLLFRPAPHMHYPILLYLGMHDRCRGADYTNEHPDIAKMYLTNPGQTISRSDMGYKDNDKIPSSPAVMYTQYPISRAREGFAVMLRDNILSGDKYAQDRLGCVKLAIGGYFDNHGMFTFEKIMLPNDFINPGSRRKHLKATPIHEDSIKGALHYATLCTEQMFARKRFTPEYNFEKSLESAAPETLPKVQSYTP